MIDPIITDRYTGRELWRADNCAEHCGVKTSTWHSYSRSGNKLNVPQPIAHLDGRTPLWDAEGHAARPGSPVPNHPTPGAESSLDDTP